MTKKDLASHIDKFAQSLAKAATWPNGRPIGIIKKGAKDYLYEFYCYMRILDDLKINYKVEYCPGVGSNKNKFPKKPAPKTGRPYFKLIDKTSSQVIYQVCAGTKILVKQGKRSKSPDISFQVANADPKQPKASEVKVIMDAKYIEKDDNKVGEQRLDSFIVMISSLGLFKADQENIKYDKFSDFKGNCFITNGRAPVDDAQYLDMHKVSQVEDFSRGKKYKVVTY